MTYVFSIVKIKLQKFPPLGIRNHRAKFGAPRLTILLVPDLGGTELNKVI